LEIVVVTSLRRIGAHVIVAASRLLDFFEKNPNPFQMIFGVLRTEFGHVLGQMAVCINEEVPPIFESSDGVPQLFIPFLTAGTA
jgi:hypothetical protein